MIDIGIVQIRFPTLIDYSDNAPFGAVEQMMQTILDAEDELSEAIWGRHYEKGMALLVAHRTVIAQGIEEGSVGAAFPVSQASADGVSMTIAVPTDLPPSLAQFYTTAYGAQYMELARQIGSGPRLVQ